jgi:hypothetical protein
VTLLELPSSGFGKPNSDMLADYFDQESMMSLKAGYVLHCDQNWLTFPRANSAGSAIAYVRGAGAPMRNVEVGGIMVLLERGRSPKVTSGWARFISDQLVPVSEAWDRHREALGAEGESV